MNMNSAILLIVSLSIMAVGFAFFMLLGALDCRERKRKYDYLSGFIFEYGDAGTTLGIASRTFLSLYFVGGVFGSFSLLFESDFSSFMGLIIFLGVLAFLSSASAISMSLIPTYHFGPHLLSTVVFFFSSIMVDAVGGIVLLNAYSASNGSIWVMVIAIALFVLALFLVALLFNPKLSRWTELSSYMDEDGAISTCRPRPFVLAFSEWLGLYAGVISFALIAIGSFLLTY